MKKFFVKAHSLVIDEVNHHFIVESDKIHPDELFGEICKIFEDHYQRPADFYEFYFWSIGEFPYFYD